MPETPSSGIRRLEPFPIKQIGANPDRVFRIQQISGMLLGFKSTAAGPPIRKVV